MIMCLIFQHRNHASLLLWYLLMTVMSKCYSILDQHITLFNSEDTFDKINKSGLVLENHRKPLYPYERWVLLLQPYEYNIMYAPGHTNIADALSRLMSDKGVVQKTRMVWY